MDKLHYNMKYVSENSDDILFNHDRLPISFTITEDKVLKHLDISGIMFPHEKEDVTEEFIDKLENLASLKVSIIEGLLDNLISEFKSLKSKPIDKNILAFNTTLEIEKNDYSIRLELEKDFIMLHVNNYLTDDYEKCLLNFTEYQFSNIVEIYNKCIKMLSDLQIRFNELDNELFEQVTEVFNGD